MGGNTEIHQFIQVLCAKASRVKWVQGETGSHEEGIENCEVYILPNKPCNLAAFIAREDFIYERQILVPFYVSPMIPMLRDKTHPGKFDLLRTSDNDPNSEAGYSEAKGVKVLPEYLKYNELQYYLNEADAHYKMKIFAINAYEDAGSNQFNRIYMHWNLSLSMEVQEIVRNKEWSGHDMFAGADSQTGNESFYRKMASGSALKCSIKVRKMGFNGEPKWDDTVEKDINVHSLFMYKFDKPLEDAYVTDAEPWLNGFMLSILDQPSY